MLVFSGRNPGAWFLITAAEVNFFVKFEKVYHGALPFNPVNAASDAMRFVFFVLRSSALAARRTEPSWFAVWKGRSGSRQITTRSQEAFSDF